MANTLENLEMGMICENPLNERSMKPEEIEIIKESILEVGLLHPLAVYKESENKYMLVSGHKRFAALQALGRGGKATVQCMVVDKPTDMTREAELMARANVHRSSPDQIKKEVELVSSLWNSMDTARRKKLTDTYRRAFEEANATDPRYISDPSGFVSSRFRPRLEYIRHITGLSESNRTISAYLTETLKNENEDVPKAEKAKRERTITEKMLAKAIKSLDGLIEGYSKEHELTGSLEGLKAALTEAAGDIG